MRNPSQSGVLHLVSSFEQGGSERQALQLVASLQTTGRYRVYLASLRPSGVLRDHAQTLVDRINEYPLTSFHNVTTIRQLRRLATFLVRERIDIVQTHDFYSNVFGMAGASLAAVGVRVAARREIGGIRTPAQKLVERCAYRLAHAVVVNARAVGEQLAREGVPHSKLVVVYNGLSADRVTSPLSHGRSEALARLGLPANLDRKYVTIVANMRYPVKDHVTFLRAAARVMTSVPEAAFLLAGEGELQESLQGLSVSLGLSERATFLGRCEHIAELLSVSDVCVLSSRAEGFPNAVLEYMAAGCPVVATDVGGIAEAVVDGESGYLVPVGDAEQMASRIISLLHDSTRRRSMGAYGRRIVQERFSAVAQLERTEELYDTLLRFGRLKR